jgi:5-methyltetrahydrofolate--homocysteine methyltransferase
MVDTVVSSATREVVIGSGRPFVIIGERINPTGRKKLAEEMKIGDFSTVVADTHAQVAAGTHMLDVNAGIPLADEPAILAETVQLVQSLTDVPLSIDSSIVAALEAGLAVYQGKPLVNSVTGEDERIEQVLPLVAKHGAAVVAITNDETGISEDPDVRFAVAEKIVRAAADHGIPAHDIVVDPLVMPIGAMGGAGRQVFALVRRLHDELGVNTTCGASNISFGLPNRNGINGAFLAMAIANGMTSAITSPLHEAVRQAVMAADVLMGSDEHCAAWIGRYREDPTGGPTSGRRGGREGRRRGAGAGAGEAADAEPAAAEVTPAP